MNNLMHKRSDLNVFNFATCTSSLIDHFYSQFLKRLFIKGLVARCHSFCIFFIFLRYTYIHLITYITFVRHHLPRSLSISSSLWCSVGKPPCGAEPRIELGPALQQADALPTEQRRTMLSNAAPETVYRHFREFSLVTEIVITET
jgi:hypothetical protein